MAELTGKLNRILEKVSGTSKNGEWVKQEFLVDTDGPYPKKVIFNLWGKNLDLLNGLQPGADLTIHFEPESREYNGRWYTDLRAFRIDQKGTGNPSPSAGNNESSPEEDPFRTAEEADDDLPF